MRPVCSRPVLGMLRPVLGMLRPPSVKATWGLLGSMCVLFCGQLNRCNAVWGVGKND